MVSDHVIRELRDEIKRLHQQASLIEAFLEGLSSPAGSKSITQADLQLNVDRIPLSNGSFAAQVRGALREIGRTATSRQVADLLIERGLSDTKNGKPLKDTVSVELFRMSRKGTGGVRKVARGQYRIENN